MWRAEWVEGKNGKPGKWSKVPHMTTGRKASSTDPATWASWPQVLADWKAGRFDGVGFVLTAGDEFAGIDLDECIDPETGEYLDNERGEFARGTVARFGTYAEKSPSGTGVRLFLHGEKPAGRCKDSARGLEVYDRGRFLTVTGDELADGGGGVEGRREELAAWHAEQFPPEVKSRTRPTDNAPTERAPLSLSDQEVLRKARGARNGATFSTLCDGRGDQEDQSGADAALCFHLAFWTRDPAQIERLWLSSGLAESRPDPKKYERRDYIDTTIKKALDKVNGYDPDAHKQPASTWKANGQARARRQADESEGTPAEGEPSGAGASNEAEQPGGFALDDIGDGERFAAEHSKELRYCKVWEAWLTHREGRWQVDAHGEAERRAKATARRMADEAAREADDDRRARRLKHAAKLARRAARETMLKDAASEPGMMATPEELDADPQALNLANGILNLQTGELGPHDPARLLSKQAPVRYDPQAECPTWRRCMARWIPDEETRDFLQEAFGVSLSGKVYEEFFMFLFGGGDNGKSTFLRILEQLLGSYWHKTQAETLMKARDPRQGSAPAPELLALKGARLVTAHEIDSAHELNPALLKDLTGRDIISARGLYEKKATEFLPQFTLWTFGNGKPQVKDTSAGMWRRVRLIDFGQPIPSSERDPLLGDKLTAELPGVLNWALEGLRRVHERGLVVPSAVKAATDEYRTEQDPVAQFIQARCVTGKQHYATALELWGAWGRWCGLNSERSGTQATFGAALKRHGCEPFGHKPRRWQGIAIAPQEHDTGASEDEA